MFAKQGYAIVYLFLMVIISLFAIFGAGKLVVDLSRSNSVNEVSLDTSEPKSQQLDGENELRQAAAKMSATSNNLTPVQAETDTQPGSQADDQIVTPYALTQSGVANDLATLGWSLTSLQAQGIQVQANEGKIPKRCISGPSGSKAVAGLALLKNATYPACANGTSPVYEAYREGDYGCFVIYNKDSSDRISVLAHELAHCLHFQFGRYRDFDIDYKAIRPSTKSLTSSQFNEIVADDFMICYTNRDTAYGDSSYYSRYGINRPTSDNCGLINEAIESYLIKR